MTNVSYTEQRSFGKTDFCALIGKELSKISLAFREHFMFQIARKLAGIFFHLP